MIHNFDYIPLSILIFQNKKIIYFNQNMKNIFMVLNKEELLKKISYLLPLSTEEDLFDFLIKYPDFNSNEHKLEVKHMKTEYDLFIFTKLNKELNNNTNNTILKMITRDTIEVLSFFKGIKLYSNEEIIKIDNDKLILNISKKQILNLLDNKEFFIKINNQCYSAKCSSYIKDKKIAILDNLTKETHNAFNRDEVRLKITTPKIHVPFINKDMNLYDISEKSVCFISDEDYNLENLTKTINIEVPFLQNLLYLYFIKKVPFHNKFKYIFHLNSQSKELTHFLHQTQKDILLNVSNILKNI